MSPLLCVPFYYNRNWYQMLLRHPQGDRTQLRVTVMNGDLEKSLHGHSDFKLRNGSVLPASQDVPREIIPLHAALMQAIEEYYEQHPFEEASFA